MTRPACLLAIVALITCSPSANLSTPSTNIPEDYQHALQAKGEQYKPRTTHLRADGSPIYINALILETSPYLLQHAHNPVNWMPWSDKAFERAQKDNKPVLLSVGYSTCHWCHVMEHESFEDLEIAKFINENYIPIKVDREERPDVDAIYMSAVHALAGRGGWPMTVIMTPDREPFFAGTYFPPRAGVRGSRRGFIDILHEFSTAYKQDPNQILKKAKTVSQRIAKQMQQQDKGDLPNKDIIAQAVSTLRRNFDPKWGGFSKRPKFPRSVNIELLARHYKKTKDKTSLNMLTHTLEQMAAGGIYDQIGGGFHRYAVDQRWLVPHFEKMLYDNAQLATAYLEGYQLTQKHLFANIAQDILDYVDREMTHPRGGFYSATDADSVGSDGHPEEGLFFTWTPEELQDVLGKKQGKLVGEHFGITAPGNFEGRSIPNLLHYSNSAAEIPAKKAKLLEETAVQTRAQLYLARANRIPPGLDDKILTSWNGLMISAFARVGQTLNNTNYIQRAENAAGFILQSMRHKEGWLWRSWRNGQTKYRGYLDDYAFLIQGLLDLYEANSQLKWLSAAIALQTYLDKNFWDETHGGYYFTSEDHERLLTRNKPSYDGAEPGGNSVAFLNLLRLEQFTLRPKYRERAEEGFRAFSNVLRSRAAALPKMLCALDYFLDRPLQIALIEPENGIKSTAFQDILSGYFIPNRAITHIRAGQELKSNAQAIPWLKRKKPLGQKTTAYICRGSVCELPTNDLAKFKEGLLRYQQGPHL
ncbi:MAG: thioredoxin domain-containing protein [Myxococcales bacterium]|nr:thioredoxin domain-containing protein [Myxococcales bacterium]